MNAQPHTQQQLLALLALLALFLRENLTSQMMFVKMMNPNTPSNQKFNELFASGIFKKKGGTLREFLIAHNFTFDGCPGGLFKLPDAEIDFDDLAKKFMEMQGYNFDQEVDHVSTQVASKTTMFGQLFDFFLRLPQIKYPATFLNNANLLEILGMHQGQITPEMNKSFYKLLLEFWFSINPKLATRCSGFEDHLPHFILKLLTLLGRSVKGIEVEPLIRSGFPRRPNRTEIMVCSSVGSGNACLRGEACRFLHPENQNVKIARISTAMNGKTFTVCCLCPVHEESKIPVWGTNPVQCTDPECSLAHIVGKVVKDSIYLKKHNGQKSMCSLVSECKGLSLEQSSPTNGGAVCGGGASLSAECTFLDGNAPPLSHKAEEWIELQDPVSGRKYYWDTETGYVQWQKPNCELLISISASSNHGGAVCGGGASLSADYSEPSWLAACHEIISILEPQIDDADFQSCSDVRSREGKGLPVRGWCKVQRWNPPEPEFVFSEVFGPTKTAKQRRQEETLARLKATNPRLYKALMKKN